jgi:formylglycine-generating enzyme required for sulfatase activity
MGSTGNVSSSYGKGDDYPMYYVTWYDAVKYCNALSKLENLEPAYSIGEGTSPNVTCDFTKNGYRLPTEAEWEYAALGGENYKYSGSDNSDEVSWSRDNSNYKTHPVGYKKPNGYKLYDMSGNVWEWCWDWYGDYADADQTDPTGPSSGSSRINRGSCFDRPKSFGDTVNSRRYDSPLTNRETIGFRVVRR